MPAPKRLCHLSLDTSGPNATPLRFHERGPEQLAFREVRMLSRQIVQRPCYSLLRFLRGVVGGSATTELLTALVHRASFAGWPGPWRGVRIAGQWCLLSLKEVV